MERYSFIKNVGEGSYGHVFQAKNKHTGEIVAIKRIKGRFNSSWDECLKLNEVQSLRKMNHPNIIKLKDLIHQNDVLFFVFEYMDCNLLNLLEAKRTKPFSESEIKTWCVQVFTGLAHMHHNGYFHRDLKPENLLVKQDIIKIADLGMACEINSQTPFTDKAGTLWYQAPELLLQMQFYDSKVDMWSMGAIMAEMFMGCPLFPGVSEADQLSRICTFTAGNANLGNNSSMYNPIPNQLDNNMSKLIPNASAEAISLMKSLCSWNPLDRPTATEALQHPFFRRGCIGGVPRCLPLGPTILRVPPPGFESSCGSTMMSAAAAGAAARGRVRGPPPGFESSCGSTLMAAAAAAARVRGPPPGFESSCGSTLMAAAAARVRVRGPPPGFESSCGSTLMAAAAGGGGGGAAARVRGPPPGFESKLNNKTTLGCCR